MYVRERSVFFVIVLTVLLYACEKNGNGSSTAPTSGIPTGEIWITTGDKSSLLERNENGLIFGAPDEAQPVIEVDTTLQYQAMDGFGFSLTGGSADVINQKLDPAKRHDLLRELFLTDGAGIGISYLRITIGASDLDDHVFSYVDYSPEQKPDVRLTDFSLREDEENLIPVLKEILQLNPDIKIMGSPWSAPAWMKTNGSPKGGSLKKEYYPAYAQYFVKYLKAMREHGIPIDAITLQNEPENPKNNPSMEMTAEEQAEFVKNHLGPAFRQENISTKIVVFDHNCDHPEYPITIFNDPDAKAYIDGSAFHLYEGEIEALSKVHEAHPDKHLYFTEQWTSSEGDFDGDLRWHVRNLIIGAPRNWSRNVLEWNLASDPQFDPHTDQGGCSMCKGALTIGDSVTRNVSYYIIAHASKFVPPGSVRVASNIPGDLYNVAYITPGGRKVLIVVNDGNEVEEFGISFNGRVANTSLPAGAVGTYTW